MRAVYITRHGGPEVLEVREAPDPSPGPMEVRVRTRACGLNFAELTARQGLYPDAPKPPCVVGYEGSGVIDAVGTDVSGDRIGERVVFMSHYGGHSDTVCVPDPQAVPMPEGMSFEHGAALPVSYVTAYHMLFEVARVRPSDHLLVHMAAGGVGTAVLQLCRTVEDLTTYGTASAHKHDHLRAEGCHHPIDYRSLDYAEEVLRLSDGQGMHVVLDALGGPDWRKGYGLLRPGGTLVAFGLANVNRGGRRRPLHVLGQLARVPWFTPMKLMNDNRAVAGVNLGNLWQDIDLLGRELRALLTLYEEGRISPRVHGTYPFSRAADAFGALENRENIGKVLLTPEE